MLGARVSEFRERRGFSLEELALKSGVSADVLACLETGEVECVDARDLLSIADVLDLDSVYDYANLMLLNRFPLSFKAYCVGLPKTGTTSMADLFSHYRSAHEHLYEATLVTVLRFDRGEITPEQYRAFVKRRDVEAHLEMDSASFNHFYLNVLAKEFREAKFIFTIRDCYSWLDSVLNMYLRGDPGRGYDATSGKWVREFTEFFFGIPKWALEDEEHLQRNLLRHVNGPLRCWASRNEDILRRLPRDRSLIVRTHEISRSVDRIARFVGVPPSTLASDKAHSYKAAQRFNVLRDVDGDALEDRCRAICAPLMERFFPGYTLEAFLRGQEVGERSIGSPLLPVDGP